MNDESVQIKKPDEIYCPNCATPIKKDAVMCPYCGVMVKELKVSTIVKEPIDEEKVVKFLKEGKSRTEIVAELIKQNWTRKKANQFVSNIDNTLKRQSPEYRKSVAKRYRTNMIVALIIGAVGTIVTIASYNMALTSGGRYLICWGAIFFGIIYFFVGLIGWLRYRR